MPESGARASIWIWAVGRARSLASVVGARRLLLDTAPSQSCREALRGARRVSGAWCTPLSAVLAESDISRARSSQCRDLSNEKLALWTLQRRRRALLRQETHYLQAREESGRGQETVQPPPCASSRRTPPARDGVPRALVATSDSAQTERFSTRPSESKSRLPACSLWPKRPAFLSCAAA